MADSRKANGEEVPRRVMSLSDFVDIEIDPAERHALMDKVQRGKRLSNEEAMRVCAMLMQIIQKDEKARSDAELFLSALSARYGIEIKVS